MTILVDMHSKDTRTHVVGELYDTERSYVESLQYLVEKYMKPLKNADTNRHLIEPSLVDDIFHSIPEILAHHERFLEELRVRLFADWDTSQVIGTVFHEVFTNEQIIDTYRGFINNWKNARQAIKLAIQARPAFERFLEAMSREHRNKLTLDALLIMPVQRIPRYELLIKELIKHTPDSHPDHEPLMEAQKEVHKLALEIDHAEKEMIHQEQLKELEALFDGHVELQHPQRDFLRYDLVTIVGASTALAAAAKKERVLFLFCDLLIMTSVKKKASRRSHLQAAFANSANDISLLEGNKFKLLLRVSLDQVEVRTSEQFQLRRHQRLVQERMRLIETDLQTLRQIETLSSRMSCVDVRPINEAIRQLSSHLEQMQLCGGGVSGVSGAGSGANIINGAPSSASAPANNNPLAGKQNSPAEVLAEPAGSEAPERQPPPGAGLSSSSSTNSASQNINTGAPHSQPHSHSLSAGAHSHSAGANSAAVGQLAPGEQPVGGGSPAGAGQPHELAPSRASLEFVITGSGAANQTAAGASLRDRFHQSTAGEPAASAQTAAEPNSLSCDNQSSFQSAADEHPASAVAAAPANCETLEVTFASADRRQAFLQAFLEAKRARLWQRPLALPPALQAGGQPADQHPHPHPHQCQASPGWRAKPPAAELASDKQAGRPAKSASQQARQLHHQLIQKPQQQALQRHSPVARQHHQHCATIVHQMSAPQSLSTASSLHLEGLGTTFRCVSCSSNTSAESDRSARLQANSLLQTQQRHAKPLQQQHSHQHQQQSLQAHSRHQPHSQQQHHHHQLMHQPASQPASLDLICCLEQRNAVGTARFLTSAGDPAGLLAGGARLHETGSLDLGDMRLGGALEPALRPAVCNEPAHEQRAGEPKPAKTGPHFLVSIPLTFLDTQHQALQFACSRAFAGSRQPEASGRAAGQLWLCLSNGYVSHIALVSVLRHAALLQQERERAQQHRPAAGDEQVPDYYYTVQPLVEAAGDICKAHINCIAQVKWCPKQVNKGINLGPALAHQTGGRPAPGAPIKAAAAPLSISQADAAHWRPRSCRLSESAPAHCNIPGRKFEVEPLVGRLARLPTTSASTTRLEAPSLAAHAMRESAHTNRSGLLGGAGCGPLGSLQSALFCAPNYEAAMGERSAPDLLRLEPPAGQLQQPHHLYHHHCLANSPRHHNCHHCHHRAHHQASQDRRSPVCPHASHRRPAHATAGWPPALDAPPHKSLYQARHHTVPIAELRRALERPASKAALVERSLARHHASQQFLISAQREGQLRERSLEEPSAGSPSEGALSVSGRRAFHSARSLRHQASLKTSSILAKLVGSTKRSSYNRKSSGQTGADKKQRQSDLPADKRRDIDQGRAVESRPQCEQPAPSGQAEPVAREPAPEDKCQLDGLYMRPLDSLADGETRAARHDDTFRLPMETLTRTGVEKCALEAGSLLDMAEADEQVISPLSSVSSLASTNSSSVTMNTLAAATALAAIGLTYSGVSSCDALATHHYHSTTSCCLGRSASDAATRMGSGQAEADRPTAAPLGGARAPFEGEGAAHGCCEQMRSRSATVPCQASLEHTRSLARRYKLRYWPLEDHERALEPRESPTSAGRSRGAPFKVSEIVGRSQDSPEADEASSRRAHPDTDCVWLGCDDGSLIVIDCLKFTGAYGLAGSRGQSADEAPVQSSRELDESGCTNLHVELKLAAPVCDIVPCDQDTVFVALSNGQLVVFSRQADAQEEPGQSRTACLSNPQLLTLCANELNATSKLCLVDDQSLWYAYGRNIFVLSLHAHLNLEATIKVPTNDPSLQFSLQSIIIDNMELMEGVPGIWVSFKNSHSIQLYDVKRYNLIAEVDLFEPVNCSLSFGSQIVRQHKTACLKATSLLNVHNAREQRNTLLVGTSAGVLLCLSLSYAQFHDASWRPQLVSLSRGHSGQVKFLHRVELIGERNDEPTSSTFLLSGGSGYDLYASSSDQASPMSEHDCPSISGDDDNLNHLILWQL